MCVDVCTQKATCLANRGRNLSLMQRHHQAPCAVVRDVPFDAIQLSLYEALKRRAIAERGRDLVAWENALLASIAGAVAGAATTPLDVVKTRLMTQTKTVAGDRYRGAMLRGKSSYQILTITTYIVTQSRFCVAACDSRCKHHAHTIVCTTRASLQAPRTHHFQTPCTVHA